MSQEIYVMTTNCSSTPVDISNQDEVTSSELELEREMLFSSLSRLPVIVILGATGTGKSKLAISLAKRFNGEIISADSMQIYKGLDILTNKVTTEEMCGVPHHMIGITNPSEKFDVVWFQREATKIVERILLDGKLPLVVGGTNYYIESLLWQVLMQASPSEKVPAKRRLSTNDDDNKPSVKPLDDAPFQNDVLKYFSEIHGNFLEEDETISKWTSQELHSALRVVDPERAQKFHPNERRKVLRSLQVRFQTGQKHSALIEQQRRAGIVGSEETRLIEGNQNSHLGGPLRYPNSFCLWIQVPKEILEERINSRVDEMVAKGLQSEISAYIDHLREMQCDELDFTRGLLQSIGFKEFQEYLKLLPPERGTDEGAKKFSAGIELLKIATRQYAKKQIRWVKQRFLRPSRRQIPPVYWLDGTDAQPDGWTRNVANVAETIVEAHLLNQSELVPLVKERLVPQIVTEEDDLTIRECPVCTGRIFVGRIQYDLHLKSHRHKRMVARRKEELKLAEADPQQTQTA